MAEVTIYGAGIFGLSVAWSCARRGATVRVIDPYGPGAGSSGGLVGALAPHVPEQWNDKKAFQFDSLIMAQRFWDEVARASGHKAGYARLGRLQPVADDAALALARQRMQGAAELWQGMAEWRVRPRGDLGPWAPESASGWLIEDNLSARLHPRMVCTALVAAIRAKGGEVLQEGAAQGRVVWATGVAGLEEISAQRPRAFGNAVKGQAALLRLDRRDCPQIFAGGALVVPHADGTVAVGSTSERDFDDPAQTDAQLDEVLARAEAAVPALAGAEVIERWAGLRPRARSRAPVLGSHPLRADEFIANGGFKIGFGMAPKVGAVMADLVLEGRDAIPDGFRPEASY
ncbi:MAG: FAD-binding oxidoreductase [Sediminimonas qiaohouensis]|uniref:FAD-binding oxidoreductase n=2 Tax=Sediminimonas qiaohouensis TaxID=552061 RepID=A0A7C9M9S4_9RHOB|nr:FAD-binding oxidoreductase [Sediminimonas qiaohouensis]MTJ05081.1 FAD-binding oxidoreductase [Sediminimonas qiaohouensis]